MEATSTNALAPWRHLMGSVGKLHRALDDEGDRCVDADGVLWFRWMPSLDTSKCASQAELLALMAALCAADQRAFETLLRAMGGEYAQFFVLHRARYEAPYVMGVYVLVRDAETLTALRTVLLDANQGSVSFQRARNRFCEQNEELRSLRVPLSLEFDSSGARIKTALESTLAVRRQQTAFNDATTQNASLGARFTITTVQLDIYEDEPLNDWGMAQLGELLELGVRIPKFKIGSPFSSSTTSAILCRTTSTIQSLLKPHAISDKAAAANLPRLESLHVTTPMDSSMVVALSTAIAQSETLRHLAIDYSMERSSGREQVPMERCWQWLTYALFSRDANHQIQTLEIAADVLTELDMNTMRDLAAHQDALLQLLNPRLSSKQSPVPDQVVEVPVGVDVALVHDYTRVKKDVAIFCTTQQYVNLRVVHTDVSSQWIHFVLPGWGEARARRDLVLVRPRADAAVQVQHRIPHLRVNYLTTDEMDGLLEFLDVVGEQALRLDLHEIHIEAEELNVGGLIVSLVERCPHLQELDLFGATLQSVEPLLDAFQRGACRVSRIKLRNVTVVDMMSMHALFDGLSDPLSAVTSHLRELSFHVFERTIQDPARGSILQSCARMLGSNNQLRVCQATTFSKRRWDQFAGLIEQFDSQLLPARRAPMPLRSKLAFLSLVLPPRKPVDVPVEDICSSRLGPIDTNVIQTIFQFAAATEVRRSALELSVTQW